MNRNEIKDLLIRYNSGNCSDEEKAIIESWYLQYQDTTDLDWTDKDKIQDLQKVYNALPIHQNVRSNRILPVYKIAATLAAILIMIVGGHLYITRQPISQITQGKEDKIVPGGNKAILTLSDGSKIVLDDAKMGVLAKQAGVDIRKMADGQLIYSVSDSPSSSDNIKMDNIIETPVGGSYQINLPDGTKVWLNAASSLRFPSVFSGNSRTVTLTGEAYFQVSKNKLKPFLVKFNSHVVEVLGTSFNINSYSDEGANKTTLVEGSIKISRQSGEVVLVPGQQAISEKNEVKVVGADLEETMAWKQGYFMFKNEDIQSIMRKISRWYEVEVVYSGNIPEIEFGGTISRSRDISEVLALLQLTNSIHFRIEGRRITVMP